jgi:hypothetical protein
VTSSEEAFFDSCTSQLEDLNYLPLIQQLPLSFCKELCVCGDSLEDLRKNENRVHETAQTADP